MQVVLAIECPYSYYEFLVSGLLVVWVADYTPVVPRNLPQDSSIAWDYSQLRIEFLHPSQPNSNQS